MRNLTRRAAVALISVSLTAAIVAGLGYAVGLRVNTTGSIPVGLYRLTHAPVEKGQYVMFCPPDRPLFREAQKRGYIGAGFCPGGLGDMMKKILAAKGDQVTFTPDGVKVNDVLVPFSKPLNADPSGRILPRLSGTALLTDGEYLLMTDRSRVSFDGRYFGVVTASQIQAVLKPVITW
ncbi:conjugative transfer signal peptidase TraF [Pantoea agglomerans]|uniref:conjugative transfer signal peptidase TraF n=1 Tax=Enterobacter agglomerans TaxID=549 RepID=UPI003207F962